MGMIAAVGKKINTAGLTIHQRIDCSGKIVMPGLVNTHSHLTEILQRSFRDNLRMEVWRGYRARTEEMANPTAAEIGAAAELACAEMLKNGVTAVVDHFSTRPGLSEPKMMAILKAFAKTGMRGVLTPSLLDRDFVQIVSAKRKFAKPNKAQPNARWQDEVLPILAYPKNSSTTPALMLGPSSPFSCSDNLVREVVEMAEHHDLGIHTHLLETKLQRWGSRKLDPRRAGEADAKTGLLSQRLSAAHCVWVNAKEMDLMAAAGVSAVHNPASNLKLGSGIAPVVELKKRGINISLGTDGGDTSDSYSISKMRLAGISFTCRDGEFRSVGNRAGRIAHGNGQWRTGDSGLAWQDRQNSQGLPRGPSHSPPQLAFVPGHRRGQSVGFLRGWPFGGHRHGRRKNCR